jgi:hypothetical protein
MGLSTTAVIVELCCKTQNNWDAGACLGVLWLHVMSEWVTLDPCGPVKHLTLSVLNVLWTKTGTLGPHSTFEA